MMSALKKNSFYNTEIYCINTANIKLQNYKTIRKFSFIKTSRPAYTLASTADSTNCTESPTQQRESRLATL